MSSSSLRASGGIHRPPVSIGHCQEVRVPDRAEFHQIDGAAKKVFEPKFELHVSFKRSLPSEFLELDEEIQIAGVAVKLTARGRPEQFQSRYAAWPRAKYSGIAPSRQLVDAKCPTRHERYLVVVPWRYMPRRLLTIGSALSLVLFVATIISLPSEQLKNPQGIGSAGSRCAVSERRPFDYR